MEKIRKRFTVAEIVQARNDIKQRFDMIHELIKECEQLADTFVDSSYYVVDSNAKNRHFKWSELKKGIDFRFWSVTLQRAQLTEVMTEHERGKYLRGIETDPPEFTTDAIHELANNAEHLWFEHAEKMVRTVYDNFIDCDYGTSGS